MKNDLLKWSNYERVLRYAEKPKSGELKKTSIFAAGSILTIGILGFLIYTIMNFLPF